MPLECALTWGWVPVSSSLPCEAGQPLYSNSLGPHPLLQLGQMTRVEADAGLARGLR